MNYTQGQLDWLKAAGLSGEVNNRNQFNIKLPSGEIIRAGINPGEAATLVMPSYTPSELFYKAQEYLKAQGGVLKENTDPRQFGGMTRYWQMPDGSYKPVVKDFYENLGADLFKQEGAQNIQMEGILDRSTTEGQQIASSFAGQNVVDPQAELNKAYAQTPVVGGQQQPLGQPFGQFTTAGEQPAQPQAPKPFGDFTYGPDQPAQPNQDLSQQLNQMMTTLQGMQQQATGQVGGQTGQPGGVYTVQSGDTLSAIAARNGISLQQLLQNNPQFQANPNLIIPGQQVNLGGQAVTQQPVSPTQPPAQAITTSADTKVQNSLQAITTGDPTKSLTDIVKELSISMGLPEITNQIQELDNKMTQEISDINLNPWIDESSRSKRVALTQQKYEARKSALVERLKLQNDVVRQAVDYYQAEREYQKDMMKISLDQAQRDIENKLDEAKIMASLSGAGITDKEVAKNILNIKSSVRQDPQFKNFLEILNGYQNVEVGVSQNNAAGDLAIVNGIAKMLDPTGVVRPAEFDTVEAAQGWFEQFANIPFKVKEGRIIAPGGMERFKTLADELISTKANPIATNLRVSYSPVSQGLGVDLGVAVPELAQVEGIISNMPIRPATETGLTGEDESTFNSVIPTEKGGGYFQNLWDALIGK